MDAFIDSTIQLLIEWGLPGLFISALLAGSIVPFSSELVLVALVKLGLPPTACIQFLIDVTLFLFVLIVLQPSQCSNLLPLLMISNSILIGHLFVLTNNKTSNIFFIVATVCLILLFGFNVWTLL